MRTRRTLTPRLTALILALGGARQGTAQATPLSPAAFRADIAQLRQLILERDRAGSPAADSAAAARLDALASAADTVSPIYFELEVARIVALADNGHSTVPAARRSLKFNRVGIRLVPFGSEFYVLAAKQEFAAVLGARLLAINGRPMTEIVRMGRTLQGGTAGWRDRFLPFLLESPEQLGALFKDNQRATAVYRFALPNGRTVEHSLRAEERDSTRARVASHRWLSPEPIEGDSARWQRLLPRTQAPWSLQDMTAPFRWRADSSLAAMVVELRQTVDAPQRPIRAFLDSVTREIRTRQPRNFVLDLRLNGGGNLNTTRDFVQALPALVPGRIFVITSPWTFSAAISTVGYLKQAGKERVAIVGEEVGDRLEFWAEGLPTPLTNSGIFIGTARERHDYRTGCEGFSDCHGSVVRAPIRVASFVPDLPAPWTIASYRAGRDPAIEAIAEALRR